MVLRLLENSFMQVLAWSQVSAFCDWFKTNFTVFLRFYSKVVENLLDFRLGTQCQGTEECSTKDGMLQKDERQGHHQSFRPWQ